MKPYGRSNLEALSEKHDQIFRSADGPFVQPGDVDAPQFPGNDPREDVDVGTAALIPFVLERPALGRS